jgi:drug/metabolite transporter (DMT)-like permease
LDLGAAIDHHSRQAFTGVLMYLIAALLFAFNGTVAKAAMEAGLEPTRLTEFRNAGAFITLALFVAVWRPSAFKVKRSEWGFLIAYGVLAFAIVQFLYFFTISRLPIGIGTLLIFLAPVLVALWIRFGRKQAVSSRIWLAVALTLIGLALVAQVGMGGADLNGIGVLSGLLAAVALALYWLLGEAGQRRRDAISLSMWGFFFATITWSVLAPWWTFPWSILTDRTEPIIGGLPALPVWSILIWNVLLGTVAPFLLVLASLGRIGAQRAGLVATTEPLWAFLLAFALLGETITGVQMLGAFIVLTGIIIAETSRRSKSVDDAEFLPTHS